MAKAQRKSRSRRPRPHPRVYTGGNNAADLERLGTEARSIILAMKAKSFLAENQVIVEGELCCEIGGKILPQACILAADEKFVTVAICIERDWLRCNREVIAALADLARLDG